MVLSEGDQVNSSLKSLLGSRKPLSIENDISVSDSVTVKEYKIGNEMNCRVSHLLYDLLPPLPSLSPTPSNCRSRPGNPPKPRQ